MGFIPILDDDFQTVVEQGGVIVGVLQPPSASGIPVDDIAMIGFQVRQGDGVVARIVAEISIIVIQRALQDQSGITRRPGVGITV